MTAIERVRKAIENPIVNLSQVAKAALKSEDKNEVANFCHKLRGRKTLTDRDAILALKAIQECYDSLAPLFVNEKEENNDPWDCECSQCGKKYLEKDMIQKTTGFTDIPFYCPTMDCMGQGNDITFYNI